LTFFKTKIEFLKGVGPKRSELLNKELQIFTFEDLIQHYPFRHEDRTHFYKIAEISENYPYIQIKGTVRRMEQVGDGRRGRLVATFEDETGGMDLVWFQGAQWIEKKVLVGNQYVVFGKPARYGRRFSISHPEIEPLTAHSEEKAGLQPIYHVTEKLRNKYLDSRAIAKIQQTLLEQAYAKIPESLPEYIVEKYRFIPKKDAIAQIHFPKDQKSLALALARLKFEELFFIQIKLLSLKNKRQEKFAGQIFQHIPTLNDFYKNYLPFDLTNAQKRVIREIYADMKTGLQMNRLLQGDVGSGKTIVAFICMLMAIDHGAQACMMAPTEILADQHYTGLKEFSAFLGD